MQWKGLGALRQQRADQVRAQEEAEREAREKRAAEVAAMGPEARRNLVRQDTETRVFTAIHKSFPVKQKEQRTQESSRKAN